MTLFQAFILGIVQGITEFLPISSSAHLVLVPSLLGWQLDPGYAFAFDILVQMGTLLAVILYFAPAVARMAAAAWRGLRRRRLLEDPDARAAWLVLLATLPAVVLGIALHDLVEAAFNSVPAVSFFLLLTAALLAGGERFGRSERSTANLLPSEAVFIGFAQALALFPGISRSGATISAGLLRRLDRREAARFSFLMSIPVMLGAGLIGLRDLLSVATDAVSMAPILVGFLTAALVGYLSIRWLLRFLVHHRLYPFAAYCLIVGLIGLASGLLRG